MLFHWTLVTHFRKQLFLWSEVLYIFIAAKCYIFIPVPFLITFECDVEAHIEYTEYMCIMM
jgi:hypothetical protein